MTNLVPGADYNIADAFISPAQLMHSLWARLRRNIRIVVAVATLLPLAALVWLMTTPAQYTAMAQILIDAREPRVVSLQNVFPGISPDRSVIDSQVELLRSTRLVQRVIAKVGVGGLRIAGGGVLDAVADPSNGEIPAKMVEQFLDRLVVERKALTYVINLSYTDLNRTRAAAVANALAQEYLNDQREQKSSGVKLGNEWLQQRVAQLRQELLEAEQKVQTYKSDNNLTTVGALSLGEQELVEFTKQTAAAKAARASADAQLKQIESMLGTPDRLTSLTAALQSKVIAEYRAQHAQIVRRQAQLGSRFGADHPQVLEGNAELEKLNREITLELDRIHEGARNDFDVANKQVANVEALLDDMRRQAAERERRSLSLFELEREVKAISAIYSNFLTRLKEMEAQEDIQTADARIVSYAAVPLVPSKPRKTLVMLGAISAGLLLGCMLAFASDAYRNAYWSKFDVEQGTGLKCIAALPMIEVHEDWIEHEDGEQRPTGALRPGGAATRLALDPANIAFCEAMFLIKQACDQQDAAGSTATLGRGRVLAIVASTAGEGCSNTAINFARYIASTGRRAVLVDANLRDPSLTQDMTDGDAATLGDILGASKTVDAVLAKDTPTDMMFCAAPIGPDVRPTEAMDSERLAGFLEDCRSRFDFVVLDTAPLSTVIDTSVLLKSVDATLFVVRQGVTPQSVVKTSIKAMGPAHGKCVGVVLTMVQPDRPLAEILLRRKS